MKLRKTYLILLIFILITSQIPFTARGVYDEAAVLESNKHIYDSKSTDNRLMEYYLLPDSGIQSNDPLIVELASSILGVESLSNYNKLELLHDWVTENIWYDWDAYADKSYITNPNDAVETLQSRKGVCSGYSRLLIALLRAVGIPAKYVVGDIYNNGGNNTVHAWVEAFIDGHWIITDVTWNSVNRYEHSVFSLQQSGKRTWFDSSLEDFSVKHIYRNYTEIYYIVDETSRTLKSMYMDRSTEHISIPNGIQVIGKGVFNGYPNIKSVEFSPGVLSIDERAFEGLTNLASVTLGAVTHIGSYAFAGCRSLSRINLPDSLVSIGKSAFLGCASLKTVEVPTSVYIIGSDAFTDCVSIEILTINSDYLGRFSNSLVNLKTVTIQGGSLVIPKEAFMNCKSLVTVNMSDTVKHIGDRAFYGCTNLTEFNLSSNITTIGAGAFESCKALSSLTLSSSLRGVGEGAFDGCETLILSNKSNLSETVHAPDYHYMSRPNDSPDVFSVYGTDSRFDKILTGMTGQIGYLWDKFTAAFNSVGNFGRKMDDTVWEDTLGSNEIRSVIQNSELVTGLSD